MFILPHLKGLVAGNVGSAAFKNAALDLKFASNKSLVDSISGNNLVSFTRASSATFVDSSGVLRSAGTDVPRFDHNPTTGESLGLLVEEARTNFVLESEAFSTGWLIGAFTTSTAAVTSPSGQSSALSAKETSASNSQHLVAYLLNIPATTPYSFSVFVKPNGGNNISLRYYFADNNWIARIFSLTGTGSVTQSNAGTSADVTNISASVVPYSNGWYRISLTLTQPSSRVAYFSIDGCTSSTPTLVSTSGIEVYTGDVNRGYYLWGAQVEAGSFPTSYIPTTTATVTRAADVAQITGANFSSWYNQTEGTMFAEYREPGVSGTNRTPYAISDGTANNRIHFFVSGTTTVNNRHVVGGATNNPGNLSAALNSRNRHAISAAVGSCNAASNGTLATASTPAAMPIVNKLNIGINGEGTGDYLNAPLARITFWPTRLSNEVLQRISQP